MGASQICEWGWARRESTTTVSPLGGEARRVAVLASNKAIRAAAVAKAFLAFASEEEGSPPPPPPPPPPAAIWGPLEIVEVVVG